MKWLRELGNPFPVGSASTEMVAQRSTGAFMVCRRPISSMQTGISVTAMWPVDRSSPAREHSANGRAVEGGQGMIRSFILILLISILSVPVMAVEPGEILSDPALEARAAT